MHDKLKLLLDKIGIKEEYYSFFNDGVLEKLKISKDKKEWNFIIKLKDTLDPIVFDEINKSLNKYYNDLEAYITLKYENVLNEKIVDYYKFFLEKQRKSYKSLLDNDIYLEEKNIIIEVTNKVESNKINEILDDIKKYFKLSGFDYNLKVVFNEDKSVKIKNEIDKEIKDNSKVENKPKEITLIFGAESKKKRNYLIKDIISEDNDVVIEAYVFGVDVRDISSKNLKIITIKVSDNTDSIYCKIFSKDEKESDLLLNNLKEGDWVRINGYSKNDTFSKELVLNVRGITKIKHYKEDIEDKSNNKRVELHAHTFMSQMDGVVSVKDLIKRAHKYGHKAIAITDKNCVQAFPDAQKIVKEINKSSDNKIKLIYGAELVVVDDEVNIVFGSSNLDLIDTTYVVFDVETTGFNATSGDSLIEIGAVKINNGEIIDAFDELINPGRPIPSNITKFTHITDMMVKDCRNELEVTTDFKKWIGDLPLVAHNAKFDRSFLSSVYNRYNLGELNNAIIDTMQLSRILNPEEPKHNLSIVTKRYEVEFDEESHHRADYDAKATAIVLSKMLLKLRARGVQKIDDLKKLMTEEDIFRFGNFYHILILVQKQEGIKNLYKLISDANTKYLQKTPRILKSAITSNREGLLLGSACSEGEIFSRARSLSNEEIKNIMQFYDFIEVQPIESYNHLIQMGEFSNELELQNHIEKIISLAYEENILVVATGDVHHLDRKDKISREIIVNQKVPGGGLHYLNKKNIREIPSSHFRTTDEMLESFDFLDKKIVNEIVIENTNKIADSIENIKIIQDEKEPYTPIFEGSKEEVEKMVYDNAHKLYGNKLPKIVEDRIEQELKGIIGNGYDIIYLISQKLVKKSNEDGYIVGSRGSVGSSFVATLMGITEVNPLPAHYVCPKCSESIFEEDGVLLGSIYPSGYDLPDKICKCGSKMKKEGQDMPFATFLGFEGDKVPDIDLNFSGEYQSRAHDYTKELFGEKYVYRAGTIGTVAEKTAFGFVLGYMEEKEKHLRKAEVDRLAQGLIGVKRTTGQHPGGIVIIPNYMEVFDFTPYQYPADDPKSKWYTTHFDFEAIHDYVLKLDILGHDDPTMLKMLEDSSGIKIDDIPFDDKDVFKLFSSTESLGVSSEEIECEVGTLGVPEFGTNFVIEMLKDTRPENFAELVKISGLSHGTDVWLSNAKNLIENNTVDFKDLIGCRDDIMVYLIYQGLKPKEAFDIMEFVRKGKASKDKETWEKHASTMRKANVPEWYIDSCQRIKYMFPKAHATAYVMMALRVAWFKVHYPIFYYSAYFSIRATDFDIKTMIKGYSSIKEKISILKEKGFEATNKEVAILDVLKSALEMTARGFKFGNVDIYKSDSTKFLIDEDKKTLIPPFISIDGLGDIVAKKIVEERNIKAFTSIDDFQNRGKVSQTIINNMRLMGILDQMPETSQLSLF